MRAYSRVVLHRRILVNLDDGTTLEGVLWDEQGELLVLRGALLHDQANGEPVPMDGDILVERRRIRFSQAVGSP